MFGASFHIVTTSRRKMPVFHATRRGAAHSNPPGCLRVYTSFADLLAVYNKPNRDDGGQLIHGSQGFESSYTEDYECS